MMVEETHINDIVEDSSINNKPSSSSSSSFKEEPIVSELDKLEVMIKKDDQMVKKLEEEPKKEQVVVVVGEEIKKEEESKINQQVIMVEEAEKKGEETNADVKEEEKDIKTRQVVEEEKCRDVEEEKKLVLEEESQTMEVEADQGEQPNKTDDHVVEVVVVMDEKINNPQLETKTGGGGDLQVPGHPEEEEAIKQDVVLLESDSCLELENKVAGGSCDLKEHEKKALNELKSKIEEAILQNKFLIKKKNEVVLLEKTEDNDHIKLASKPIDEEEKLKSISKENETTTTTTEVDKKDELVQEEEKEEEEHDQVEKQKEKCWTIDGEIDDKKSNISVEEKSMEMVSDERDISLWGVPLLPSKGSEATNVILLKFLRARDFKVNEAFEMIRNTIEWRKKFKIDSILNEEFSSDLSLVAYMDGLDREGHPICYNMYGIFEDNELYQKTFGTEEKRELFLRWRYQLMEKEIRKLDFNSAGGVTSLLQINDLKNSPGPSKKELRMAMKQAVALLQDNYPEFVERNIFVNVPFWYYAFNAVLSPFLTQRTKSKFVFARPSKVTETLLRYIPAEQVPIRYGGLKRENDSEFMTDEESVVTELAIKAGLTETIEIPAPEVGTTILWDLAVLGWDVTYKAEFVPNDEGSYTIIVQKPKKMGLNEEPVRNSFKSNGPGKIVLSIENGTYKKKRAFYRYKTHN